MPRISGQSGPGIQLGGAVARGPWYLVKTDQFDGHPTYSVMTDDEVKVHQRELAAEGRRISQAHRLAAREWARTEKSRYLFACPSPRKGQVSKRYLDKGKADEKVARFSQRKYVTDPSDSQMRKDRMVALFEDILAKLMADKPTE